MLKTLLIPAFFISLFFTSAFSQTNPPVFESGITKDSTYANSYYNIQFSIPKGWAIQDQKVVGAIVERGKDMIAGDNKSLKTALDVSVKKTGYLIVASEYPMGAPVESNATLLLVAEDIEAFPGIVSGADYLFHAKRFMEQSQIKVTTKEIKKITINDVEFGFMEAEIQTPLGTHVKQNYYSTILKKHSLGFVISYSTEEQLRLLQASINSFKALK